MLTLIEELIQGRGVEPGRHLWRNLQPPIRSRKEGNASRCTGSARRGKVSVVSNAQTITSLSEAHRRSGDLVMSLSAEELAQLSQALEPFSDSSEAAARLARAIDEALRRGHTLVLGASEGTSAEDEAALHARVRQLIEQMVPDLDLPSDAAAVLARRNAKRRGELLQEFGALSGEQIAEERSRAANRHALAARWRKEGKLFGVPYRGQTLYPAFQFDDEGRLRPVIAQALTALPRDRMSEWEVALWWTSGNGTLGGHRPVDLIDDQPEAVLAAARRLGEPLPL